MELHDVIGLALIPYYFSVQDFLNLWPLNSCYLSYIIYICHLLLNKFAVDTSHLLFNCIGIMALRVKFIYFPHGISSDTSADHLPSFKIYLLYSGKYNNY